MSTPLSHELKCRPECFEPIVRGVKKFDLRFGDRDFRAGDSVYLREWDPDRGYTGRGAGKTISYVLRGPVFGLRVGWVILSLI